jgi:prolyl-tRNA editing enzyme YbaK/EbsC (Cys-tRNA(Pro) deacylase)
MTETTHPNVLAVREALAAAGATGEVRLLPDAVHTAAAAAAALGVEVGQIANSLIFVLESSGSGTSIGTEPLLVLASGAHRVDTAKLAAQLGAAAVRRADHKFVRAVTGQVIGGVAPVGHPAPLRTIVDTALAGYDEVWAGGGIPHAVFPTSFIELITLTGGTAAAVAEGS